MRRTWTAAHIKIAAERHRCRVCKKKGPVQAAHIIAREHDRKPSLDDRELDGHILAEPYTVHPNRIVPLCEHHHREYDAHRLDLLPHLTLDEQLQAVADAGGIETARIRLTSSRT